jgi:4-amino-4-deoxy-L-arabinose transferase-like glycosyltransferase
MKSEKLQSIVSSVFQKPIYLLLPILLLGLFFRAYNPLEYFQYGHDQDLAGWFVRDIVENGHLRLIGQETSTQGIFIGPLYYYMLIPFYMLFGMDPLGGVVMITLLGIFSIISVYYVFKNVFTEKEGLIASFIHAISFYLIFNDREVVPTMPVVLWTVWYFYALNLILKGKQKQGFLLFGVLVGLIWHLNVALVLMLPLIPVSIWLSKKKVKLKETYRGVVAGILLILPLVAFELRHGFPQVKGFIVSITTDQNAVISGWEKFLRVIHLLSKNLSGLFWGSFQEVTFETTLLIILAAFAYLVYKKVISKNHTILIAIWLVLYITFFSFYSKILSEYYLNGTIFIWIFIITVGISYLLSTSNLKKLGIFVLLFFTIVNFDRFINLELPKNGYLYRRGIVSEIKRDAEDRGYPCVSVSYITEPGYNLGYRYFFYLEGMHVNHPDSLSPVYTIVFPLNDELFPTDKDFGHIGLIYPDYSVYNMKDVEKSCSGENQNITVPMWGLPI